MVYGAGPFTRQTHPAHRDVKRHSQSDAVRAQLLQGPGDPELAVLRPLGFGDPPSRRQHGGRYVLGGGLARAGANRDRGLGETLAKDARNGAVSRGGIVHLD